MGEVKIDTIDITGLIGEKITVCILQLKSPFYDECTIQPVKGFNTLHWNKKELQKRKKKILSLIDQVKDLREEVNIIVLPEYSIHYEMMTKLLNKAKSKNVTLIGTYYDDRETIDHEINKNFRKNICLVIFPDRTMEDFVKLTKSPHDADFIEVPPKNEKRILRLYWQINGQKLCLQILICYDFLVYSTDKDIIDLEHGGIIIIPACSPNTDAFGDASRMCLRRHGKSNVARNVFFCNAVSLPKQQTKSSTGNSQIFGHYQGDLPILDTDVEGGIIASVFGQNILPKLSSISPNNNIVIENPITFRIEETNGKWKIVEMKPRFEAYPMTVAVSIVQKGYSFLMVRRKIPEGGLEWQFPAGIIRPKQDPKERAVEEVFNETNVKCNVTGKIGERRVHPDTGAKIIYYGCSYLSGEACNKDIGENAEVKWVKAWEVEKLVTSDLYSDVKELLRRIPRDE